MLELLPRIKSYIIRQNGIILKELFLRAFKILKIVKFLIKIKHISIGNCDIQNLVDFTLSQINIMELQQIRSEIIKLLEMVKKCQPMYILEIGTLDGGTLFLFSRIASKDALLISIDLPKGKIGSPHSKWRIYSDWRSHFIKRFSILYQKIELIRADSHKKSTLNYVKKLLNGKKLDFLFIDADHSYDGVKKDFEMYSPLVKNGGLIAFHDIVPLPSKSDTINEFWEKIKYKFDFDEFIEDNSQKTGGIGVLKK